MDDPDRISGPLLELLALLNETNASLEGAVAAATVGNRQLSRLAAALRKGPEQEPDRGGTAAAAAVQATASQPSTSSQSVRSRIALHPSRRPDLAPAEVGTQQQQRRQQQPLPPGSSSDAAARRDQSPPPALTAGAVSRLPEPFARRLSAFDDQLYALATALPVGSPAAQLMQPSVAGAQASALAGVADAQDRFLRLLDDTYGGSSGGSAGRHSSSSSSGRAGGTREAVSSRQGLATAAAAPAGGGLPACDYMRRVEFLALLSAALWLLEQLDLQQQQQQRQEKARGRFKGTTGAATGDTVATLGPLVADVLAGGRAWLEAAVEGEGQPGSAAGGAAGVAEAAALWRNRCLRTLLAAVERDGSRRGSPTGTGGGSGGADDGRCSSSSSSSAGPLPPDVWAPACALAQLAASGNGSSSGSDAAAASGLCMLQPGNSSIGGAEGTKRGAPSAQRLAFADPAQLTARARLVHHTQQLLLSERIEGGAAADRLLSALEAATKNLVTAGGKRGGCSGAKRQGKQQAAAAQEEDRAIALYRLCHALLGGSGGGGGRRGGGCHVVQLEMAELLDPSLY